VTSVLRNALKSCVLKSESCPDKHFMRVASYVPVNRKLQKVEKWCEQRFLQMLYNTFVRSLKDTGDSTKFLNSNVWYVWFLMLFSLSVPSSSVCENHRSTFQSTQDSAFCVVLVSETPNCLV